MDCHRRINIVKKIEKKYGFKMDYQIEIEKIYIYMRKAMDLKWMAKEKKRFFFFLARVREV
jgi:hypothetical protein